MSSLKLGEQASDFTLASTSDEQYSFEEYREDRGGWHLLVFFRGNW